MEQGPDVVRAEIELAQRWRVSRRPTLPWLSKAPLGRPVEPEV